MRNDMDFSPAMLITTDHVEAWKLFMLHAINSGRRYLITSGSHAGSERFSIDSAHAYIRYPETRPLAPIANPGLIPPVGKVKIKNPDGTETEMDEIEHYFHNYVLNPHGPQPDEHYNYSEWLYPLAQNAIDYYSEKGFGNAHAVLRVGDPFCFRDYFKPIKDECSRPTTPCLLGIDTRIVEADYWYPRGDKLRIWQPLGVNAPDRYFLIFYVYYRSWDLFGGFLTNMGGFQLLKEYMAAMIEEQSGKAVYPGPSIVQCKDLHLYSHHEEAAKAWIGMG
jgi:thymidylate synthase